MTKPLNIVFLRGAVPPPHENPQKLYYKTINKCEDMWTQLFYEITKKLKGNGILVYQNGHRSFKVNNFFTEIWTPSLQSYQPPWKPDLIFCRGGFPYYDQFVKKFPLSKKIYYGAGKRYYPTRYDEYDLFLTDSKQQLHKIKTKGKNASLFIKPAAKLFKPTNSRKDYDICFMANATQAKIKRHWLFLDSIVGSNYKVFMLGNTSKKLKKYAQKLKIRTIWDGWSLRKDLPKKISRCKVGVCCSTNYDSCPRVIPEYLACNVPIVVTDNVNFWHEKYINESTGMLVNENHLFDGIKYIIDNHQQYSSALNYYNDNLSMEHASDYLCSLISKLGC